MDRETQRRSACDTHTDKKTLQQPHTYWYMYGHSKGPPTTKTAMTIHHCHNTSLYTHKPTHISTHQACPKRTSRWRHSSALFDTSGVACTARMRSGQEVWLRGVAERCGARLASERGGAHAARTRQGAQPTPVYDEIWRGEVRYACVDSFIAVLCGACGDTY